MSQSNRHPQHGPVSSVDFNSLQPKSRPRLERPNSSPSTATTASALIAPSRNIHDTLSALSSSSSTASSSTAGPGAGTSGGSRGGGKRPPNAVLPGRQRPKTAYQAVTWKENLDAFNRRLRRGSLSFDAEAQEEEMASQALAEARAQAKAQQKKQARETIHPHHHRRRPQHEEDHMDPSLQNDTQEASGPGVNVAAADENTTLLGNNTRKSIGRSSNGDVFQGYGTASEQNYQHREEEGGRLSLDSIPGFSKGRAAITGLLNLRHRNHIKGDQTPPSDGESSHDPAFPTLLNPVVPTKKSSKLGVFSGVFVPCVLSIWGIILFLRFGFIIGQAGVMGTMAMFIVGYAINIFTTLSLSAISTNGTVRGGGVYYLLSRSLGPEFGGSIGLIYFLGNVIGCGMNVLGFVEPLISNFGESSGTVYRVLPESKLWDFIYGTILLVLCTLVCLVGSKLFSRASLVLAMIILLSTLSIFISFAVVEPFTHPERNIEYTGFSWATLQENMWPKFTTTTGPDGPKESFQSVFGVLFPACIGILAGASMSGDLEDPSKSIPSGTLWAVGSTFCVYTFIVVLMGGSISRSTMYTDLSVLQDISVSPLSIAAGALAASVFATLGSVIGAAKILQAIARDNLLPFLSAFGQGTPKTDEPTLAVLLTFILCQFCLFLTDMNAIAMFVSMVTLLTFLIINLACFLLKIGSAPNFRPSFRFFHWWTAFGGMVMCALVMGLVDLGKSLLSGLIVAVIFIWIHYWSPPKRWGDVTQSLIYHQVRKYLLRLDSRKEHVKFWRPQILLLVHHPRSEYHLIQFCNHLKKGALYVLGHIILGDLRDVLPEYRRQQGSWLKFVDVLQVKAFVNLAVADSVRIGARNLLIGTGLGGMRPNIVVLGSFNLDRFLKAKEEEQRRANALQLRQQQQQTEGGPIPQVAGPPPILLHSHGLAQQHKGSTFISSSTHMTKSGMEETLLNIPISLPIDNIRVEAPIKITDYVSIIEDVLSLNKAVAIAYGFEKLDLPTEEQNKSLWSLFGFGSHSGHSNQQQSMSASASRASSVFHHGESSKKNKKKKYIDLWPMQMSVTPLPCFDHHHHPRGSSGAQKRMSRDMSGSLNSSPMMAHGFGGSESGHGISYSETGIPPPQQHPRTEANLTNFDTYTMVLQMGCILHMVPHWKENFLLRVMVFVEYKEDVEEEKKRLKALLENLRIPAEVKVMCLDSGDSKTYDRLVKGEGLDEYPMDAGLVDEYELESYEEEEDTEEQSSDDGEEGEGIKDSLPTAASTDPRNIRPLWQQSPPPLAEEDGSGNFSEPEHPISSSPTTVPTADVHEDGKDSSHETGPYSNFAGHGPITRSRTTSSSGTSHQQSQPLQQVPHHPPIFEASGPPPQRRRTISHPDKPKRIQSSSPGLARAGSVNVGAAGRQPLRSSTALSPRLRQGGFLTGGSSSAHPIAVSGTGLRYRSSMMVGHSGSPSSTSADAAMASRLGTSVPLGASMNFRIAVPLPRQYFDPNGMNSESESDSISSEDDETYDHNDDDLVYGGGAGGSIAGVSAGATVGQRPTQQFSQSLSPLGLRQPQPQQQHPHLLNKWQPTLPTLPQQPPQQQQQPSQQTSSSESFAHTSLGSEPGLGIAIGPSHRGHVDTERDTPDTGSGPGFTSNFTHHPFRGGDNSGMTKNPWVESSNSSASHSADTLQSLITSSLAPQQQQDRAPAHQGFEQPDQSLGQAPIIFGDGSEHVLPYSTSPPADQNVGVPGISQQYNHLQHPSSSSPIPALGLDRTDTMATGPSPPIQFDHLGPEAQLLILNELMRIHSSSETTSIVFTTVPAPEEGTSLSEQSSIAYVDQLDSLMEGIDVPVLLIHAKSLTVTMTL